MKQRVHASDLCTGQIHAGDFRAALADCRCRSQRTDCVPKSPFQGKVPRSRGSGVSATLKIHLRSVRGVGQGSGQAAKLRVGGRLATTRAGYSMPLERNLRSAVDDLVKAVDNARRGGTGEGPGLTCCTSGCNVRRPGCTGSRRRALLILCPEQLHGHALAAQFRVNPFQVGLRAPADGQRVARIQPGLQRCVIQRLRERPG